MGIETDPAKLDEIVVLLDDVRTEVIEAQKAIATAMAGPPHATLQASLDTMTNFLANPPDTGIQAQLQEVLALLAPVPQSKRPWWKDWRIAVGGALVAGLALGWGGAQWGQGKVHREAALMRGIDGALVERFALLPSAVQQSLASVYRQFDFQDPGTRKKGGK